MAAVLQALVHSSSIACLLPAAVAALLLLPLLVRSLALLLVCCSQLQAIIDHPEAWVQLLGTAIPQTSNYFLNYVIMRAFMLNFVRLLMPREGACCGWLVVQFPL